MKKIILLGFIAAPLMAHADIYNYATLTSMGAGTVHGTMLNSDGNTINVDYSGDLVNATQINNTGTYYYTGADKVSPGPYVNGVVDNAPSRTDIIALEGQNSEPTLNTITFSSAVTNPIFDIVSLGQPTLATSYNFGDSSFSILSQDAGWWGGSNTGLSQAGNVLTGTEGSGVIQFSGTFTSISFTATPTEFWHGFNVGVDSVPEPSAIAAVGIGLVALVRRRKKA
jgi:hypothetical protein